MFRRTLAWALPGLLFCGACSVPGGLRDPRVLPQGQQRTDVYVAATRLAARLEQNRSPSGYGQITLPEVGGRQSGGLWPAIGFEAGLRAIGLLDGGIDGSLKWQWLGFGRPRAVAGTLSLDVDTTAWVFPNDIGSSLLFALPIGPGDLCLGAKGGYRGGEQSADSPDPTRVVGPDNVRWPQGAYGELQCSWQGRGEKGPQFYGGATLRQDLQPTRRETTDSGVVRDWAFEPAIRVELGLAFNSLKLF